MKKIAIFLLLSIVGSTALQANYTKAQLEKLSKEQLGNILSFTKKQQEVFTQKELIEQVLKQQKANPKTEQKVEQSDALIDKFSTTTWARIKYIGGAVIASIGQKNVSGERNITTLKRVLEENLTTEIIKNLNVLISYIREQMLADGKDQEALSFNLIIDQFEALAKTVTRHYCKQNKLPGLKDVIEILEIDKSYVDLRKLDGIFAEAAIIARRTRAKITGQNPVNIKITTSAQPVNLSNSGQSKQVNVVQPKENDKVKEALEAMQLEKLPARNGNEKELSKYIEENFKEKAPEKVLEDMSLDELPETTRQNIIDAWKNDKDNNKKPFMDFLNNLNKSAKCEKMNLDKYVEKMYGVKEPKNNNPFKKLLSFFKA